MTQKLSILAAVAALAGAGLLLRPHAQAQAVPGVPPPPNAPAASTPGRYQMTAVGGNVLLLDTATGRLWTKYIGTNSGPSQWENGTPPEIMAGPPRP